MGKGEARTTAADAVTFVALFFTFIRAVLPSACCFSDESLSQNSFVMVTIGALERTSFDTDQLWMGTIGGCC